MQISRDCIKIKSVKTDRSQTFETSRIKLDICVPHVLTERNLLHRINDCDALIRRQRNDPFLKRVVASDEKWVVCNNVKRKISWSKKEESAQTTSKPDIHQKQVMSSVWWNFKEIVYFELLPNNTTINSEIH